MKLYFQNGFIVKDYVRACNIALKVLITRYFINVKPHNMDYWRKID